MLSHFGTFRLQAFIILYPKCCVLNRKVMTTNSKVSDLTLTWQGIKPTTSCTLRRRDTTIIFL